MGKIKQKTLDKLVGLADEDLKTTTHDELFVKFFDRKIMSKVLAPFLKRETRFKCEMIKFGIDKRYCQEKTCEYCNVGWNELGFNVNKDCPRRWDILHEYHRQVFWEITDDLWLRLKIKPEYVIKRNDYILGFVDFYVAVSNPLFSNYSLYFSWHVEPTEFIVEIKPEIKNVGQVLRQMNFYSSQLKGDRIIITKTKGFEEIFEKAGVHIHRVGEK